MPAALVASAFIGSALVLVPLPWHLDWRARNIAILSIIAWLFILNLSYGVNAVIWAGNVDIVLPIWCDIVTKIKIGATFALPSSCLCLALQLHAIASSLETGRGRRGVVLDVTLCYGVPFLIMALHYIVQGHRFDIVEDFGCRPAIYISLLSLLLIDLPPVVASFLVLVYCGMALFYFFRRRTAFIRMINASDSGLTTSSYIRLMSMTTVLGTWNAIIISIGMRATYGEGLRPWTGWSDVHSNFSRIQPYPNDGIPESILQLTYLLWAAVPISSLFFFLFFAFGNDAMKEYRRLFRWVRRNVLKMDHRSSTPEITSMNASSLGTFSDRRFIDLRHNASSGGPSSVIYLTPPPSHYMSASRPDSGASSAPTISSNGSILPLEPTVAKTEEHFYGDPEMEFWAI
ncbi:putative fungal pheromone GPCR, STE3-type [Mycena leptocephala]|nr:putative fungal pheromone GPCR, STE3-type [Mycena leptocephala]